MAAKSPAEARGIKLGDLITEVDQKKIANVTEFNAALAGANAKKGIALSFLQKGEAKLEVLRDAGE